MSTGVYFTLEQDGKKVEGPCPPSLKSGGPLAPLPPLPVPPPMQLVRNKYQKISLCTKNSQATLGQRYGLCVSYTLEINQLYILHFWSHFEAHVIVSSRAVNSKVLRVAILYEYFFW